MISAPPRVKPRPLASPFTVTPISKPTRFTLIYPPSPFLIDDRTMPPLGLLSIAAVLEQAGHEVKVHDFTGDKPWRNSLSEIANESDIVGFTCVTPQIGICNDIKKEIQEKNPEIAFTIGGPHPSSIPEECVRDGYSAVVGEGENAVLRMPLDLDRNSCLNAVYEEPLIPDLDALPFPARHLIDIKSYNYKIDSRPASSLFTQRGCSFACISADSLISTLHGDIPISKISRNDILRTIQGFKTKILAHWQSLKETWQVETENNYRLEASAEHLVFSKRGWIPVNQLTENDEILVDA